MLIILLYPTTKHLEIWQVDLIETPFRYIIFFGTHLHVNDGVTTQNMKGIYYRKFPHCATLYDYMQNMCSRTFKYRIAWKVVIL